MTKNRTILKNLSSATVTALSRYKVIIAISVIVCLVYFNRIEFADVSILTTTWPWLIVALLLMFPPCLILSYRFKLVLRSQSIDIPFWLALRWTMVGYFFDLAMPSSNGGDIVKAGYVAKHVDAGLRTRAVMAVGFDRVIGMLGLFSLALIASIIGWKMLEGMQGRNAVFLLTLTLTLTPFLIFWVIGSGKIYHNFKFNRWLDSFAWGDRLRQIFRSFNSMRETPLIVLSTVTLSIINHIFWCSSLIMIAYAVGNDISVIKGFVVFPLAIFGNIFGIAGGFGLGTAGFDLILRELLSVQNGALIGLLFQTLSAFSRLVGLPFYLRK